MRGGFYLKCGQHFLHVTEGAGVIWVICVDGEHATRFDDRHEAERMASRIDDQHHPGWCEVVRVADQMQGLAQMDADSAIRHMRCA